MPHDAPTPGPDRSWPHYDLFNNVVRTLYALPDGFESSLKISDFRATDVFTLNSALSASIEDAVVKGLNARRAAWDVNAEYMLCRFERQAQAFPDMRLVRDSGAGKEILMGVELKGWFALSKEGEPTFRYTVNPNVCAPADLLVVYPWVLSDVIAGSPRLLRPFVWSARAVAEQRNAYWRDMRAKRGGNGAIVPATHQHPYPAVKTDQCADRAEDDAGGNFGRVARYGLLDEFVKETRAQELSGIPVAAWLTFFRHFGDSTRGGDLDEIEKAVEKGLTGKYSDGDAGGTQPLRSTRNTWSGWPPSSGHPDTIALRSPPRTLDSPGTGSRIGNAVERGDAAAPAASMRGWSSCPTATIRARARRPAETPARLATTRNTAGRHAVRAGGRARPGARRP